MIKRAFIAVCVTSASILPAAAQTPVLRLPNSLSFAAQAVPPAQQPQPATPPPAQSGGQAPAAVPAGQGPRVPLGVDEAVKLALDHNLDISVQRLNQDTYDVAIASLEAVYSPTLNSTLSTQRQTQAATNTISGASSGSSINTDNVVWNGGLSQNMAKYGGSYFFNFNNSRSTSTSLNTLYNPTYNGALIAQFTQPVMRNFKIDANRQAILVTKINQEISDIQLQQTITNTVANVRNAYYDYVFAIQSIDVAQQSLNLAEELVKNNQTKVEIGTMAPIDVVQAQSQAAAQRQALVTAQGTARTAEIGLKRLIVSGTNDPLWSATIDPTDRPNFSPTPIDVDAAIQHALANRTDVQQAKKNLEANAVTLNYLEDQTLPQADIVARYQTTGIGGTRFETTGNGVNRVVTNTIPGGYLDALRTIARQDLPTWSLALNWSYPLGMSATKASVAKARIQQNQIDQQLKQIDLAVASDVSNSAVQVENTAERVQAAQAARDLAQQQLDAENSKFSVGMSTNYNVVQAQRDLATAQNAELQAILAYRRSLVEFERVQATGNGGTITIIGR